MTHSPFQIIDQSNPANTYAFPCEEVFEFVEELHEPRDPESMRRAQDRYPRHVPITVEIRERTKRNVTLRFESATLDISHHGLAMVYHDFFHPGSDVRIHFHTLKNQPVVNGIVRHCTPMGGAMNHVGIEFTGDD